MLSLSSFPKSETAGRSLHCQQLRAEFVYHWQASHPNHFNEIDEEMSLRLVQFSGTQTNCESCAHHLTSIVHFQLFQQSGGSKIQGAAVIGALCLASFVNINAPNRMTQVNRKGSDAHKEIFAGRNLRKEGHDKLVTLKQDKNSNQILLLISAGAFAKLVGMLTLDENKMANGMEWEGQVLRICQMNGLKCHKYGHWVTRCMDITEHGDQLLVVWKISLLCLPQDICTKDLKTFNDKHITIAKYIPQGTLILYCTNNGLCMDNSLVIQTFSTP